MHASSRRYELSSDGPLGLGRGDRAAERDGVADCVGGVDTQLPIGLGAEGVVDGGEGDAQGHEDGDGEDLGVVEAGGAQRLHVGGGRRVRIAGELAGPAGERPLGAVERRVVAAQHALGDDRRRRRRPASCPTPASSTSRRGRRRRR